jgi:hypothetical protein
MLGFQWRTSDHHSPNVVAAVVFDSEPQLIHHLRNEGRFGNDLYRFCDPIISSRSLSNKSKEVLQAKRSQSRERRVLTYIQNKVNDSRAGIQKTGDTEFSAKVKTRLIRELHL